MDFQPEHGGGTPGGAERPGVFEWWEEGITRLTFRPPRAAVVETLLELVSRWQGRYRITYVLLKDVPGLAEAGRYEYHGTLDLNAVKEFFRRHGSFIAMPGPHDLWLSAAAGPAFVIHDRHGCITVFGDGGGLRDRLIEAGYSKGFVDIPDPAVPGAAASDHDKLEALMQGWKWLRKPLNPHDLA